MLRKLSTRSFRFGAASFALASALVALAPSAASAQYYSHRRGPGAGAVAAGVIGGLALGALAARPYYYGRGPTYVLEEDYPPPPPPRCWYEREDVWNGYGYTPRRIRVCR